MISHISPVRIKYIEYIFEKLLLALNIKGNVAGTKLVRESFEIYYELDALVKSKQLKINLEFDSKVAPQILTVNNLEQINSTYSKSGTSNTNFKDFEGLDFFS